MDLAAQVKQDPAFADRYELGEKLGEGGMGTVHRAVQRHLDRPVAIKLMRPELLKEEEPKARFFREAQTAAKLIHANVCVVHDFGLASGVPFLVSELVEGSTLGQLMRGATGGLPAAQVIDLARQVLEGLEAIHAQGLIHRDLKPGNIVITPEGRAKILDFGLAKTLSSQYEGGGATIPGMVVGTPMYMSPEQATAGKLTPAADLYSFAVILFELITDRKLFNADSHVELLRKHIQQAPEFPAELAPPVHALLARGLAKQPTERFQSAAEMRGELMRLSGAVVAAGNFRAVSGALHATLPPVGPAASAEALTAEMRPAPTTGLPASVPATVPEAEPVPPPAASRAPLHIAIVGLAAVITWLALQSGRTVEAPPSPATSTPAPVHIASPPVEPVSVRPTPPPSVAAPVEPSSAPPSPSPEPSRPHNPIERFAELHRMALEKTLEGVNLDIAKFREHQGQMRGRSGKALMFARNVQMMDHALIELLEMAAETPNPRLPRPTPRNVANYGLLIAEVGAAVRANDAHQITRSFEQFDPGDAGVRPAPLDFLGLHHDNTLDWLYWTAVLGRTTPTTRDEVARAAGMLEGCLEGHPAGHLAVWSGEVLEAFYAKRRQATDAARCKGLAIRARTALAVLPATPTSALDRFNAGVVQFIRRSPAR